MREKREFPEDCIIDTHARAHAFTFIYIYIYIYNARVCVCVFVTVCFIYEINPSYRYDILGRIGQETISCSDNKILILCLYMFQQ